MKKWENLTTILIYEKIQLGRLRVTDPTARYDLQCCDSHKNDSTQALKHLIDLILQVKDIYDIPGLTDHDKAMFKQYEKEFTVRPPGRTFDERINARVSTQTCQSTLFRNQVGRLAVFDYIYTNQSTFYNRT